MPATHQREDPDAVHSNVATPYSKQTHDTLPEQLAVSVLVMATAGTHMASLFPCLDLTSKVCILNTFDATAAVYIDTACCRSGTTVHGGSNPD